MTAPLRGVLDTYADTLPVWTALTLVAGVALVAVLAVPTAPPPDATRAANAAAAVAASDHAAARTIPIQATAVRLRPGRLALRNAAGTAHAVLRPRITPAVTPRLRRVLEGAPPGGIYPSVRSFRAAARRVRERSTDASWRPAPRALSVRHVVLGGADVTLVG